MNTYGLVRVSTLKQKDNTSLDFQTKRIKDYCEMFELPLTGIITETESGGRDLSERSGLKELQSLIKTKSCSTIVVNKVDRLGRSLLQGLMFLKYCEENDVRVICIENGIDTLQPQSKLITNILFSIAENEKDQIKQRLSDGREKTFEDGKKPFGGHLSFGYRKNNQGEIVLDKFDSNVVKFIYQKWNDLSKNPNLSKTKRTQKILKLLKKSKCKFHKNNFRTHNIKDILTNSMYCGELKWRGQTTKSSYPTIVSKRLFNVVQSYV